MAVCHLSVANGFSRHLPDIGCEFAWGPSLGHCVFSGGYTSFLSAGAPWALSSRSVPRFGMA